MDPIHPINPVTRGIGPVTPLTPTRRIDPKPGASPGATRGASPTPIRPLTDRIPTRMTPRPTSTSQPESARGSRASADRFGGWMYVSSAYRY